VFFLELAHLGSPGQRDVKRLCVCVAGECGHMQWLNADLFIFGTLCDM